ncbi:glycosyltransferase [Paenibacillus typhae]|uniref:glycosyltransferase n=1 Tax=Paenibacillus typhae TaxID=1174501 RepID=UPI001C8D28AE|nr:glycosyltransferase [Paenibacillus typhae]
MIVKDEEKILDRCLNSVKDKVDEIIVVDTGSSDNTIEIAKQYTASVYTFAWTNDFSEARNYSLQQATKEYILVLDADEYLDADADLQQELSSKLDYYLFNIKNYHSYGQSFTHSAVRLFKNDTNLYYENRLHEHLNIVGNDALKGGEAATLIHHTGYSAEKMDEKAKLKRNLPLMQQAVRENPDAYNLYNMGKTYMSLDEHLKAVEFFKRAYPLSTNRVFLPELLVKLAYSLGELGRNEEGLNILNDAVHVFPEETEMWYIRGELFAKTGYYKDAIASFEQCLKIGDSGSLVLEGSGSYKALESLGGVYEKHRQLTPGFDAVLKSLQAKKNYTPALKRYFNITLKAKVPLKDVYETIKQLYNIANIEDLHQLLNILYELRHPLLSDLLTQYSVTSQKHVEAVAKLFNKHYEDARIIWNEMPVQTVLPENGPDILLLAYILQDQQLLKLAIGVMNMSQREAKLLNKLIGGGELKAAEMTGPVEALLLEMARNLIILQEVDLFEMISAILLTAKLDTKIKLCELLVDYGYEKPAFDQLVRLYEEKPANVEVLRSLGDLCCRLGYFDDAEVLYARLMELLPVYSSFESCYSLYEGRRNFEGMRMIWLEIKRLFPLSQWDLALNGRTSS